MQEVRCGSCERKLAEAAEFLRLKVKCPRCGTMNDVRAWSPLPERPGASNLKGAPHGENSKQAGFEAGRKRV
jgi:phage FluMu protein Com